MRRQNPATNLIPLLLKEDGFLRLDFKNALDQADSNLDEIRAADGKGLLHLAAEHFLCTEVVLLLLQKADPNLRDASGRTPLHYVIGRNADHANLIRDALLFSKADVNAADHDGVTPLMIAAREGNRPGVEILLWLGAEPCPKDVSPDEWPINQARRSGQNQIVELLSASASIPPPTLANAPQQVPAFVQRSFTQAARVADFDRLQTLLPRGAQLNGWDAKGSTALLEAINNLQPDVVTYLLMVGANPNVPSQDGVTPFMATSGWFGLASDWMRDMLVLAGADPVLVSKKGNNSLTFACYKGNEHAAQWAIWTGANPVKAAPIGTPMKIASKEGQQKIIDLLRRNGVTEPLYVENDPGRRLILAARRNDVGEVLALLANGVRIDAVDENGNNAVMNAIFAQRLDIARLFLQKGSAINFTNPKNGTTPLRATTVWRYQEIEDFRLELLEAGANPNLPDREGITPFIAACMHGDLAPKITQMLEHGAELNLRDAKGRPALWHSRQNGRTEAYAFLKERGGVE